MAISPKRQRKTPQSPEYTTWKNMIRRCSNPKDISYPRYGGRGISVSPELMTLGGFLAHIGMRPPGTSIDRIDNSGNYEPGNIRWATSRMQHLNRTDTLSITCDGKTQTLVEWSEETGISQCTLWARLYRYKWSTQKALETPVMSRSASGTLGAIGRWNREAA